MYILKNYMITEIVSNNKMPLFKMDASVRLMFIYLTSALNSTIPQIPSFAIGSWCAWPRNLRPHRKYHLEHSPPPLQGDWAFPKPCWPTPALKSTAQKASLDSLMPSPHRWWVSIHNGGAPYKGPPTKTWKFHCVLPCLVWHDNHVEVNERRSIELPV